MFENLIYFVYFCNLNEIYRYNNMNKEQKQLLKQMTIVFIIMFSVYILLALYKGHNFTSALLNASGGAVGLLIAGALLFFGFRTVKDKEK